jgi:colanic acid biosynthesis glycosyl transferase WcaI
VHFVGLGRGLAGYVVPSRINGVLSVGRPAIVAADADSEIALLVEEGGCGIAIAPGRADLLAGAIRDAYEGRYDLAELGRRGREYAVANLDESILIGRYKRLIAELLA